MYWVLWYAMASSPRILLEALKSMKPLRNEGVWVGCWEFLGFRSNDPAGMGCRRLSDVDPKASWLGQVGQVAPSAREHCWTWMTWKIGGAIPICDIFDLSLD